MQSPNGETSVPRVMIGRRIPTTVSITSPNRLAFNGIPGAAGAAVSVCKVRATEGAGG